MALALERGADELLQQHQLGLVVEQFAARQRVDVAGVHADFVTDVAVRRQAVAAAVVTRDLDRDDFLLGGSQARVDRLAQRVHRAQRRRMVGDALEHVPARVATDRFEQRAGVGVDGIAIDDRNPGHGGLLAAVACRFAAL